MLTGLGLSGPKEIVSQKKKKRRREHFSVFTRNYEELNLVFHAWNFSEDLGIFFSLFLPGIVCSLNRTGLIICILR